MCVYFPVFFLYKWWLNFSYLWSSSFHFSRFSLTFNFNQVQWQEFQEFSFLRFLRSSYSVFNLSSRNQVSGANDSVTRAKNPKSAAYLPKIATFIAPIFKVHFFRPNSRPTNKCLFFMQSLAILWHFITWIVWYSNHLPISLRKLDGIWKKKYFSKILK